MEHVVGTNPCCAGASWLKCDVVASVSAVLVLVEVWQSISKMAG